MPLLTSITHVLVKLLLMSLLQAIAYVIVSNYYLCTCKRIDIAAFLCWRCDGQIRTGNLLVMTNTGIAHVTINFLKLCYIPSIHINIQTLLKMSNSYQNFENM